MLAQAVLKFILRLRLLSLGFSLLVIVPLCVNGVKTATKIKTDLKRPITKLACHPRHPVLSESSEVAYLERVIRAYNIQTFAVLYTMQIEPTVKLAGAGAVAFHPTLEWVFVGDRCGTLLAWDVSVPSRPNLIGIVSTGISPIISLSWISILNMLVTLTKEGTVQVWQAYMRASFLEPAGVDPLDITTILSQGGGVSVYPPPRINLATLLFAVLF